MIFYFIFWEHCYGSWVLSACTSRQVVHLYIAKCLPLLSLLASIVVLIYTFFLFFRAYSCIYDWYIDCNISWMVCVHKKNNNNKKKKKFMNDMLSIAAHFIIINTKILFPKNIPFGICLWRKVLLYTCIQQLGYVWCTECGLQHEW